ncbi:hypothetical protein A4R89_13405 [Acetobacter ascendens]|nr:hypothetical protein A4R89_13405 [Acetobacter ascendens]
MITSHNRVVFATVHFVGRICFWRKSISTVSGPFHNMLQKHVSRPHSRLIKAELRRGDTFTTRCFAVGMRSRF